MVKACQSFSLFQPILRPQRTEDHCTFQFFFSNTAQSSRQFSKSSMAHPFSNSDYLADSESSDFDLHYDWESDCSVPKMKPSYKHHNSRRVTVRTPSEEDLYQEDLYQQSQLLNQSRRPSTPYALTRHSSYTDEESFLRKKNKEKQQRRVQTPPVAAGTPNKQPATAPATAVPQPGVQSYNNPAGSTAACGFNNVYLHGAANPNVLPTHQPYAIHHSQPGAPYFYGVNTAGQPAHFFNMPEQLGGYQNSVPFNPGMMHYQPQTPDTSFGPMHHNYVPRFDGGGVYMVQPGGVCHPVLSFLTPGPPFLSPPLTVSLQEVHPLNFAPQALVLGPQPTIAVCPPYFASAPVVMTTLGHKGPDGVVSPHEIVVRRDSSVLLNPSSFLGH